MNNKKKKKIAFEFSILFLSLITNIMIFANNNNNNNYSLLRLLLLSILLLLITTATSYYSPFVVSSSSSFTTITEYCGNTSDVMSLTLENKDYGENVQLVIEGSLQNDRGNNTSSQGLGCNKVTLKNIRVANIIIRHSSPSGKIAGYIQFYISDIICVPRENEAKLQNETYMVQEGGYYQVVPCLSFESPMGTIADSSSSLKLFPRIEIFSVFYNITLPRRFMKTGTNTRLTFSSIYFSREINTTGLIIQNSTLIVQNINTTFRESSSTDQRIQFRLIDFARNVNLHSYEDPFSTFSSWQVNDNSLQVINVTGLAAIDRENIKLFEASDIFAASLLIATGNRFEYIFPPSAWYDDDYDAEYVHSSSQPARQLQVEMFRMAREANIYSMVVQRNQLKFIKTSTNLIVNTLNVFPYRFDRQSSFDLLSLEGNSVICVVRGVVPRPGISGSPFSANLVYLHNTTIVQSQLKLHNNTWILYNDMRGERTPLLLFVYIFTGESQIPFLITENTILLLPTTSEQRFPTSATSEENSYVSGATMILVYNQGQYAKSTSFTVHNNSIIVLKGTYVRDLTLLTVLTINIAKDALRSVAAIGNRIEIGQRNLVDLMDFPSSNNNYNNNNNNNPHLFYTLQSLFPTKESLDLFFENQAPPPPPGIKDEKVIIARALTIRMFDLASSTSMSCSTLSPLQDTTAASVNCLDFRLERNEIAIENTFETGTSFIDFFRLHSTAGPVINATSFYFLQNKMNIIELDNSKHPLPFFNSKESPSSNIDFITFAAALDGISGAVTASNNTFNVTFQNISMGTTMSLLRFEGQISALAYAVVSDFNVFFVEIFNEQPFPTNNSYGGAGAQPVKVNNFRVSMILFEGSTFMDSEGVSIDQCNFTFIANKTGFSQLASYHTTLPAQNVFEVSLFYFGSNASNVTIIEVLNNHFSSSIQLKRNSLNMYPIQMAIALARIRSLKISALKILAISANLYTSYFQTDETTETASILDHSAILIGPTYTYLFSDQFDSPLYPPASQRVSLISTSSSDSMEIEIQDNTVKWFCAIPVRTLRMETAPVAMLTFHASFVVDDSKNSSVGSSSSSSTTTFAVENNDCTYQTIFPADYSNDDTNFNSSLGGELAIVAVPPAATRIQEWTAAFGSFSINSNTLKVSTTENLRETTTDERLYILRMGVSIKNVSNLVLYGNSIFPSKVASMSVVLINIASFSENIEGLTEFTLVLNTIHLNKTKTVLERRTSGITFSSVYILFLQGALVPSLIRKYMTVRVSFSTVIADYYSVEVSTANEASIAYINQVQILSSLKSEVTRFFVNYNNVLVDHQQASEESVGSWTPSRISHRLFRVADVIVPPVSSSSSSSESTISIINSTSDDHLAQSQFKIDSNFFHAFLSHRIGVFTGVDLKTFACTRNCSAVGEVSVTGSRSNVTQKVFGSADSTISRSFSSYIIDISGFDGVIHKLTSSSNINTVQLIYGGSNNQPDDFLVVEVLKIEMRDVHLSTSMVTTTLLVEDSLTSILFDQVLLSFDSIDMQTLQSRSANAIARSWSDYEDRSYTLRHTILRFECRNCAEGSFSRFDVNFGAVSLDHSVSVRYLEIENVRAEFISDVPLELGQYFYGFGVSAFFTPITENDDSALAGTSFDFGQVVLNISNITMTGNTLINYGIDNLKNVFQAVLFDIRCEVIADLWSLRGGTTGDVLQLSSISTDRDSTFDDEVSLFAAIVRVTSTSIDADVSTELTGASMILDSVSAVNKEIAGVSCLAQVAVGEEELDSSIFYFQTIIQNSTFIFKNVDNIYSPGNISLLSYGGNLKYRKNEDDKLTGNTIRIVRSSSSHSTSSRTRFSMVGFRSAVYIGTGFAEESTFTFSKNKWEYVNTSSSSSDNSSENVALQSGVFVAPIYDLFDRAVFGTIINESFLIQQIATTESDYLRNTSWIIRCDNEWPSIVQENFIKYVVAPEVAHLVDANCSSDDIREKTNTTTSSIPKIQVRDRTNSSTLSISHHPHNDNDGHERTTQTAIHNDNDNGNDDKTPTSNISTSSSPTHSSLSHSSSLDQTPSPDNISSSSFSQSLSMSNSSSLSITEHIVVTPRTWPPSPIPPGLSSATTVIAAASGFPGAAVLAQKLRVLSLMSRCVTNTNEDFEPSALPDLEFDSNPTTIRLGIENKELQKEEERRKVEEEATATGSSLFLFLNIDQYRGSLVGNAAIIVGFVIVQYLLGAALLSVGRSVSFDSSLADVHAPGLAAVLIMTFSVPSAMSVGVVGRALSLNSSPFSVSTYLELAVGIFFFFALPLVGFYYIAQKLKTDKHEYLIKMPKPKRKYLDDDDVSCFVQFKADLQYRFDYLLEGSKNWRETNFVRRFCDIMDCCSVPMFIVFDYFIAIFVGLISGLSLLATSKRDCLIYAILILIASAIHTAACFILKPMTARFDSWFGALASVLATISSIFALMEVLGVGVDIEEALMYVATLCMLGAAFAFLGSAAPAFKSLKKLLKAQRVARKRSDKTKKKKKKEKEKEKEKEKKHSSRSRRTNLLDLDDDDAHNDNERRFLDDGHDEELVPVRPPRKNDESSHKKTKSKKNHRNKTNTNNLPSAKSEAEEQQQSKTYSPREKSQQNKISAAAASAKESTKKKDKQKVVSDNKSAKKKKKPRANPSNDELL